jgi:putative transposase
MRYKRLKVEGASYFFTVVTHERRKLFLDADVVAWYNEAVTRVQQRHPFDLEAQVVLPDHLHALWQLPRDDADYSTRWRLIKEAFTKAYLKHHGPPIVSESRRNKSEQGFWQRRFWEHLIRDDRDFGDHLDYIHLNPVRHGFVVAPSEWPYSSFARWVALGVYEPNWGSGEKQELPEWAREFE